VVINKPFKTVLIWICSKKDEKVCYHQILAVFFLQGVPKFLTSLTSQVFFSSDVKFSKFYVSHVRLFRYTNSMHVNRESVLCKNMLAHCRKWLYSVCFWTNSIKNLQLQYRCGNGKKSSKRRVVCVGAKGFTPAMSNPRPSRRFCAAQFKLSV